MIKIFFWTLIGVIIYAYIGYPIILQVINYFFFKKKLKKKIEPFVSLVISVYNEEDVLEAKLANLLSLQYPRDKIEILIGSDGSTDKTNKILHNFYNPCVFSYIYEKRRGKPSVLNDLLSKARGEIVIFTDARQILEKNAIVELVSNFADKQVGCVSGELILKSIDSADDGLEGLGIYWKYEKFIRERESSIHSMIGATGAIYAIRKELFRSIPANTILDDVCIPLFIVQQKYRSIFDRDTKAYDKPSIKPAQEYRRKVRTLTGNYQIFSMFIDLFNPFKSPIAFQIFSHKLLRLLVPFFMIIILGINIILAKDVFYVCLLICQISLYMLALRGAIVAHSRKASVSFFDKLASGVYTFFLLNFAAFAGLFRYLTNKQNIAWIK